MAKDLTHGQELAKKLHSAFQIVCQGPAGSQAALPTIWGVNLKGELAGITPEQFVARGKKLLLESGRVFRWGDRIVLARPDPAPGELVTLAAGRCADPAAALHLSNVFTVGLKGEGGESRHFAPQKPVAMLLASDPLWAALPEIRRYARRPAFDADYTLLQPGWHPPSGTLVHADPIAPIAHEPPEDPEAKAVDRLPPRLRGLLGEFNWRSDADLVNATGLLLTGLLMDRFVEATHPGALVDGNQPGLGKTLLVQSIGLVLDGAEPAKIAMNGEEELEKQLASLADRPGCGMILIDNVRGRLDSPILEQKMLSPALDYRILGRTRMASRPNDLIWAITSNTSRGTADLIRRCVPIRLHHEGDPKGREFAGDPARFAREHRGEILGELAGMVIRWVQQGCPKGSHRHRCAEWAATIGGILGACGLGSPFLANLDETESEMDEGMADLAALAEAAIAAGGGFTDFGGGPADKAGRPPGAWPPVFATAQVLRDQLAGGAERARATLAGQFLSARAGRTVEVEVGEKVMAATLRARTARAKQRLYHFELVETPEEGPAAQAAEEGQAAQAADDGPAPACPVSGPTPDVVQPPTWPDPAPLQWC